MWPPNRAALGLLQVLVVLHFLPNPLIQARICQSVDVRNDIRFLNKLENCTSIAGDLRIVLIERVESAAAYDQYRFPNLTEITGYLMMYQVAKLRSIDQILPNLRAVRGLTKLVMHFSIIFHTLPDLEQIGLSNLLYVGGGNVIVDKCPKLCYVDTVNWSLLKTTLTSFETNENCTKCLDHCTHCWNADTCQESDTDKCHEECLGCTVHHSSKHCKVCKNFRDGDECVKSCPEGKYQNKIKRTCVTEQECNQMDKGPYWIFDDQCLNQCPEKYQQKDHLLGGCEFCGENCQKSCNFTGIIEDSSESLRGCTYLNGSLQIKLFNKYAAQDLAETLSSLRIIEGFLKIYRSDDIRNLHFLHNLREIRGTWLENNHHAIYMYENANLQSLWDYDNFNLTIKNGTIAFVNNPKLCLSEIEKLANLTGLTGKYTDLDVDKYSNGDKSICRQLDLNCNAVNITATNATLAWQQFEGGDDLATYTIFYAPLENNVSIPKSDDICGKSDWKSFFTLNTTYFIKDLLPFTTYVFYIKVLGSKGGQSQMHNFTTLSDDPKLDMNIEALAHNSSAINVTWPLPKSLNGHFAYYQIIVYQEPDNEQFLQQRDYCTHKFKSENKPRPKPTQAPPTLTISASGGNCTCAPEDNKQGQDAQNQFVLCDSENTTKYGFDQCKHYEYRVDGVWEEGVFGLAQTRDSFYEDARNYRVINVTDYEQTSVVVGNLSHFRTYVFYVQACNVNRTARAQCSGVYQASNRTMRDAHADDIVYLTVNEQVDNSVSIQWHEPQAPNSLILSYDLTIVQDDNRLELNKCIQKKKYNPRLGFRTEQLGPGSYTVRVRVLSLAGYGTYSLPKYFSIRSDVPDRNIAIYTVLGLFVVAAALAAYGYYRYRNKRLFENIRLIANINPEYHGVMFERDDWEIERDNVVIEECIGEGTFGNVHVGYLRDQNSPCAIKKLKDQLTLSAQHMFLNEASVMKAFSDAHHVVKLYGVVSVGQPILVIMELMDRGDLKNYLRSCRENSSNNITSKEMYRMAVEIADGMAYLSAKKYVHRDLAVRNCMVAQDHTVKIGDFGLTRDVYSSDYYKKETRGLLPVRWMAPESLLDGVFTSDSDVWSYGIVLWEIVTLAEQPYQGKSNNQVYKYVSSGRKLSRPQYCPDALYDIMVQCWNWMPIKRPTFLDIIQKLLPLVGQHFTLVSFYHSRDGLAFRLNHRDRPNNPPAILQTHQVTYDVNEDSIEMS